jgi:hypothetical protein
LIVFVVMKAQIGLEGAEEFVGVFPSMFAAEAVCRGGGTFRIARMELGRAYGSGELLDVVLRRSINRRELFGPLSK